MVRNEAINHNTNNQNYREANRFMVILNKNILPLTASLDKIANRYDLDVSHKDHKEVMLKELTRDVLIENFSRR
jgi:hypothetical protein